MGRIVILEVPSARAAFNAPVDNEFVAQPCNGNVIDFDKLEIVNLQACSARRLVETDNDLVVCRYIEGLRKRIIGSDESRR